jgi:hypothetical protein
MQTFLETANDQERCTGKNVHAIHDQRPETFATSHSRYGYVHASKTNESL